MIGETLCGLYGRYKYLYLIYFTCIGFPLTQYSNIADACTFMTSTNDVPLTLYIQLVFPLLKLPIYFFTFLLTTIDTKINVFILFSQ